MQEARIINHEDYDILKFKNYDNSVFYQLKDKKGRVLIDTEYRAVATERKVENLFKILNSTGRLQFN